MLIYCEKRRYRNGIVFFFTVQKTIEKMKVEMGLKFEIRGKTPAGTPLVRIYKSWPKQIKIKH